jgi:hypothetical protein
MRRKPAESLALPVVSKPSNPVLSALCQTEQTSGAGVLTSGLGPLLGRSGFPR